MWPNSRAGEMNFKCFNELILFPNVFPCYASSIYLEKNSFLVFIYNYFYMMSTESFSLFVISHRQVYLSLRLGYWVREVGHEVGPFFLIWSSHFATRIPSICQFLGTTTLFRPVKGAPKVCKFVTK